MEEIYQWVDRMAEFISFHNDDRILDTPIYKEIEEYYSSDALSSREYWTKHFTRVNAIFLTLDQAARIEAVRVLVKLGRPIFGSRQRLAFYIRLDRDISMRVLGSEDISTEDNYVWIAMAGLADFYDELRAMCESYNIPTIKHDILLSKYIYYITAPDEPIGYMRTEIKGSNVETAKLLDQLLIKNKKSVINRLKNIPNLKGKRMGLAIKMLELEGIMHPIGDRQFSQIHRELTEIFGDIHTIRAVGKGYDNTAYEQSPKDVASIKSAYYQR